MELLWSLADMALIWSSFGGQTVHILEPVNLSIISSIFDEFIFLAGELDLALSLFGN
jgi:hypothetical protein